MHGIALTALARQHLRTSKDASSGRSAHTVYGGHEHVLPQTLIALAGGQSLDGHENRGEPHWYVPAPWTRSTSRSKQTLGRSSARPG